MNNSNELTDAITFLSGSDQQSEACINNNEAKQTFSEMANENFPKSPGFCGKNNTDCGKMSALYPASGSAIPYNPNYRQFLDANDLHHLSYYAAKTSIDLNAKLVEENERYRLRAAHEELKERIKLRQAEAYAALKERRELMREEPLEDEHGYLTIARRLPDGPTYYSKPIFSVSDMRLKILISHGRTSDIELLSWRDCPKPLRLTSNGNVTLLSKELQRAGIGILLNKNIKASVMDLVYSFLRAKAETLLLWPCFGWNQNSNGEWHFSDEREVVFDDFF